MPGHNDGEVLASVLSSHSEDNDLCESECKDGRGTPWPPPHSPSTPSLGSGLEGSYPTLCILEVVVFIEMETPCQHWV